jgi:HEAT repeat protein
MAAGDDSASRRRAAALAGHTGDEAAARALSDDHDGRVRATAYGALQRLDRLTETDLRRAAGDPDPTVRQRAAEMAAGAPEWAAVGAVLGDLLADDDRSVVELAAWACGERERADELVEPLAAIARNHPDALCREAAVAALGSLGDERALDTILAALGDKATVRRRAIIALAPFAGAEVEAALQRHTTDRDRQVRQAAEDLLGR